MESDQFPIVGIGASAGGVQALTQLFTHLPDDTGLGFIVVLHQSPGYHTELPAILARHTSMPVVLGTDGIAIERNHVYVTASDTYAIFEKGKLQVKRLDQGNRRKPIDALLSSLGHAIGDASVAVILSGSGNDGSLGAKAIKENGGLTIAQGSDGGGSHHRGMPEAAVASGIIDLVLPVEQIGPRLAQIIQTYGALVPHVEDESKRPDARSLYDTLYQLLLQQVGHDFSGYKERTFMRRVQRRMQVLQIVRLEDYVQRLSGDRDEVSALFRDLLIGVTNFFRDREAFETLQTHVIPKLFEGRGSSETVRIWVPGCATGEEVYSIAMLVREHLETVKTAPKVQIFATDIDEAALSVARAGRYPAVLLEHVASARLKRFFSSDELSYAVNKDVRDLCIFSSHSVIRDPPFSRMDLISCRNLLIYLGAGFQAQVIPVFHFALRPRGYLFLGTSENVTQHGELFTPVDKRQRIFQRRDNIHVPLQFPMPGALRRPGALDLQRDVGDTSINLRRAVESRVLERFAPAHVVVNAEGDILHYSPRTGKYLEPAAGMPNRQLLAMARRGLRLDLRAALREAIETRRAVCRDRVSVDLEDRVQLVDIVVEPFGGDESDPVFLVIFSDVGQPFDAPDAELEQSESERSNERQEQELRETRERLQSTIEEYETAVEELKSSNEELQSINEELQSTNEELETSKEELQSLNEELHTVNAELNAKVDEIDRANTDLQNLFESTQIATVFLDRNLMIRSYTPAVTAIFNLIHGDRGRPLSDIVSHIEIGDLWHEVRSVLDSGSTIERNVRRMDASVYYLMRILPYRGRHSAIEGALITFIDISKAAAAEAQQRTLVEELNHRVRNMLTIVNAIASQTLARSTSVDAFKQAFTGRIRAMGVAYGLVSQESWGDVGLQDMVARQLQPYAVGRVHIDGPRVLFRPNAALAFGMVVHELATNAVKYGALSHAQGRLDITWSAEIANEATLHFRWRETTPEAIEPNNNKGFGSDLIERELRHMLQAKADFSYTPTGLHLSIAIPVRPDRVRIETAGELT